MIDDITVDFERIGKALSTDLRRCQGFCSPLIPAIFSVVWWYLRRCEPGAVELTEMTATSIAAFPSVKASSARQRRCGRDPATTLVARQKFVRMPLETRTDTRSAGRQECGLSSIRTTVRVRRDLARTPLKRTDHNKTNAGRQGINPSTVAILSEEIR